MLTALETLANFLGKPFGLDFYFGLWCPVQEVSSFEFGTKKPTRGGGAYEVWVGPFHLAACRIA